MTITPSTLVGTRTAWSAQRVGTLNCCAKKYRYRYLLKGGWDPEAPEELQTVYRLGLLQGEPSYAGTLIHRRIRRMIAVELAGLPRNAPAEADAACREIALAVEMGASLPLEKIRKGRTKFLRQEQGHVISPTEVAHWQKHISHCLATWDQLDVVAGLLADKACILRDFLDPSAPIYTEALGVPAYLKTDVVVRSDDRIVIYDWKTGKPAESDTKQAAVYDAVIRAHFCLDDAARVEARFVYLAEGTVRDFSFGSDERAELLWQIGQDYTDLVITDSNPAAKRFPARTGRQCAFCPFQFLCTEGQAHLRKGDLR